MTADDLPAVHVLSMHVHPLYPERAEVLVEKFRLFPEGCFVLEGQATILGYCFSHPFSGDAWPPLDTLLHALPPAPEVYFVHDLTIDARVRGLGQGRAIVPRLLDVARSNGLERVNLIAVEGRAPFWTAAGFAPVAKRSVQDAVREKYGPGAVAMTRQVADP